MILRELTLTQMRTAYQETLREAFSPEELKPFSAMEKLWREGAYQPLALFEGRDVLGYAFFWKDMANPRYLLLEYLAVPKAARNRGIGAELLRLARAYYPPGTVILGESEALTGEEETDALKRRRLAFYGRTGARRAGYEIALFGVRFTVIYWAAEEMNEAELLPRHRAIYARHLPERTFREHTRIPLRPGEDPGPLVEWSEEAER